MTNKEAIEEIKSMGLIIDAATSGTRRKSIYLALTLAINALEERPQGEWIKEEDRVHSKCSLCGFKYADYGILFDYCPNCGADMREGRE